jgi:hypothetical protein
MRTQSVFTLSRALLSAGVALAWVGAACGVADRASSETVESTSSALVATTVYTTGIGLDGGVLTPGDGAAAPTDLHYKLVASTDPAFPAGNLPVAPYVVKPDTATTGQWAPDTSTGEWISPFVSTRAGANPYTYSYQTTFSMPGTIADPTKVVMTGTWACDDSCTLLVNGTQVAANTVVGTAETLTIPEGSPFVSGTNTLTFVVDNSGGYETGLLVTSFVPGCTLDTQCETATEFCDTQNGPCTPKIVNGQPVPTLTGHTPPLTGVCSGGTVGSAVCATGVCDTADNDCGLANGHGTCTANADGGVVSVCRSGVCDTDGSCGYKNGDGPCAPNDAGSVAVCRSGVCDTDSKCGLATGDGPCTTGDQTTVCRSGVCSATGHVCIGASGGCAVDTDCSSSEWCNTGTAMCTPKLANGTTVPIVTGHNPALTGACTTNVGAAVCASGVCDTTNSECGLVDGKSCGDAGATVCQSAQCNADDTCGALPDAGGTGVDAGGTGVDAGGTGVDAGGTGVDASGTGVDAGGASPDAGCTADNECAASQWCDTASGACVPKLGNGVAVPAVTGHTPALTGVCTADVGAAVCASGVCDPTNSECGLVDGKSCADAGATVCQSAQCNGAGACGASPEAGCTVDGECAASQWCDTQSGACVPKLGNGVVVPTVTGHTPALTGVCTSAAGTAVCASGVCDPTNSECGLVDGKSCVNGGAAVCQSAQCNAVGTCGALADAGCTTDSECAASQWCDTESGACVPKLGNGTAVPTITGHTPALTGTCTTAVGAAVCVSGVCDSSDNSCGYTDGNGPCTPADAGVTVCRSGTCDAAGVCGTAMPTGCQADTDCSASQWCNTATGMCSTKLPNGTSVPKVTGHTPALTGACTTSVGAAVCASGVCDPADGECGLAKGDGPCMVAQGPAVCRTGACLADFGVCGDAFLPTGGVACSVVRAGAPEGSSANWALGAMAVAVAVGAARRRRGRGVGCAGSSSVVDRQVNARTV